jgi:LacI family transcriptional regulator
MRTKHKKHVLLALSWYHPKIHRGVAHYARQAGWHLCSSMGYSHFYPAGWRGDGAIITASMVAINGHVQPGALSTRGVPAVEIGRHVDNDNDAIVEQAIDHFLQRGFRFIAFCGPSYCRGSCRPVTFGKILADSERLEMVDLICPEGLNDWRGRHEWFGRHLRKAPKPLAVFALDDDWGAELLDAALSFGIRVPDEVAILGVRNDELVCEALSVPLSSIENNLEGVGFEAAAILDRHLDGAPLPVQTVLIPPLGVVSRQSTEVLAVPHAKVVKALQFIREHSREEFSIADVARHAGMSLRGLYSVFGVHMGCTVGDVIATVRMREAESLLLTTDMSVENVAVSCGYGEVRNFYNAFRRKRHMTPREWKRVHGKKE